MFMRWTIKTDADGTMQEGQPESGEGIKFTGRREGWIRKSVFGIAYIE